MNNLNEYISEVTESSVIEYSIPKDKGSSTMSTRDVLEYAHHYVRIIHTNSTFWV